MYAEDPRFKHLPVPVDHIVSIHTSLNRPAIAIPGRSAQQVSSFLVGVRNRSGGFTLFVYFFLCDAREGVVYLDGDHLEHQSKAALDAAVVEAVGFLESMGFILDDQHFAGLEPARKRDLVKAMPCFTRDHRAPPSGSVERLEGVDSAPVRLARVLAAF